LIRGDARFLCLRENSVDSMVTDPPAGVAFMGKKWDTVRNREEFVGSMRQVFRECLEVLKPGAHALVWALPRTSHWTTTALEDAGFEIRDVITHHFGSGFPKSLDVSKAIDRAAGHERTSDYELNHLNRTHGKGFGGGRTTEQAPPATDAAKKWHGWGTRLKPASEHWILSRAPLTESTVASNVLKFGTGGLNIDASRIESEPIVYAAGCGGGKNTVNRMMGGNRENDAEFRKRAWGHRTGRWPANLVLSHSDECNGQCAPGCPVAELDRQSGNIKTRTHYDDNGGASRFFYCARPSSAERNEGLEHRTRKITTKLGPNPWTDGRPSMNRNHHPTVKSVALMQWLIRLITPPRGLVLDPFFGSGTTGKAATEAGFRFIGIEREPEYVEIAKERVKTQIGMAF